MVIQVLTAIEDTYNRLKSERTQEELREIFDISTEFKDKVIKMFKIGVDAADDAVEMLMLASSVLESLALPGKPRGIPKPLNQVMTFEDVVDHILDEVQPF